MVSFAHVRTQAHDIFILKRGSAAVSAIEKAGTKRVCSYPHCSGLSGGVQPRRPVSKAIGQRLLSPLCFRLFSFEGCHIAKEESLADRTSR